MRKILACITAILLLAGCSTKKTSETMSSIQEKTIQITIDSLKAGHPKANPDLIEKGVRNAASFWNKEDGSEKDFQAFCIAQFVSCPEAKVKLYQRIERNLEIIYGHFNSISLGLKEPVQLVGGEILPIDESFGAIDPYAHLADDMFHSKIAFTVLLNFPFYTLIEKNKLGAGWSRQEWAYARLGDLFASRIPAAVNQRISDEMAKTENYISNYNIHMEILRTEDNRVLFPDSMALITHWGLRDELKADYADRTNGLEKQRMIYQVMKHIILQTIPTEVIDRDDVAWKPVSNTISAGQGEKAGTPEPNTRYERLFAICEAMKAADPYCRSYPTVLKRAFDRDMEVSADAIENMFTELIGSKEVAAVAGLIESRLGRKLEPFDIWYDGFKSRSSIPEQEMTAKTRKLYPNTQAFEKGIPAILTKLGIHANDAAEIASKIAVDNSRGSGHAWGAQMKSDKAHLRTRLQAGGMDYKGYNIALHELGHNVEQTLSLNRVDHYLLNGIPNSAFTEALAFVFQKRDLPVLGYTNQDPNQQALQTLDIFWGCYEIMGVSLVDLRTWKWLYENPKATAEDLKQAILQNAREIWNQYFAPFLGEKDSPLLAVYSHMIEIPLYLPNYPYGHVIEFQLEKHFGTKLPGPEITRIWAIGKLTPDYWMRAAVGEAVSTKPLLEATHKAVEAVK